MNRIKLMVWMLAMLVLLAGVIVLCSPYAPPVEGPTEIETIWEIEDAREKSDAPLVTAMQNNGVPLAYDVAENTFYCTLGMENGESWQELCLTAPDEPQVSICFVDDYTYDSCADAIAEGTAYELMAYTDTQYSYFQLVFTGLPMVQLDASEEIGTLDCMGSICVSTADTSASNPIQVHTRGAGSASVSDKKSYTVQMVRHDAGGEVYVDVPTMGTVNDLLLLAMAMDETCLRDKLSWTVYGALVDDEESFSARRCEYVELFVAGEYMGVYLMMEPVDAQEELQKSGAHCVARDSVYRSRYVKTPGERPYIENPVREDFGYELRYSPSSEDVFAPLEAYIQLEQMEDDAEFVETALRCIDLESMLTYYLFIQAGGMSDNVYNNMYIWAHDTEDGVQYRFAPWDMDQTWGRYKDEETGEPYQGLFSFGVAQRMIDLDAGGITRQMLTRIWREMREDAFTQENIAMLLEESVTQLNASGAFERNAARWQTEQTQASADGTMNFVMERLYVLDALFGE